jgi:hypothetical protein
MDTGTECSFGRWSKRFAQRRCSRNPTFEMDSTDMAVEYASRFAGS